MHTHLDTTYLDRANFTDLTGESFGLLRGRTIRRSPRHELLLGMPLRMRGVDGCGGAELEAGADDDM